MVGNDHHGFWDKQGLRVNKKVIIINYERGRLVAPIYNLPGVGMKGKMPGTLPGVDLGDLSQVFNLT